MISVLIIRFWEKHDNQTDLRLTLAEIFEIALLELFMFGIQAGLLGVRNAGSAVLMLLGTVYMCSTAVIGYFTGYVYCISHFVMLLLILILGITRCNISFEFCFLTVIFLLFLTLCERVGAFSRGDSEYLAVSYIYFSCGTIGGFALEYMLGVMLMSALIFGIFRKRGARKGVTAFTPMIVFSEYIMMIWFRLL